MWNVIHFNTIHINNIQYIDAARNWKQEKIHCEIVSNES